MPDNSITPRVAILAAVSILHLWLNTVALRGLQELSILHFASLAVALAAFPRRRDTLIGATWHYASTLLPGISALFLLWRMEEFYNRGMRFTDLELVAVVITVVGAIEFARRSGWMVAAVIVVFLSYALWWGQYLSGALRFPGLEFETVLFRSVYTDDGMFGRVASISASFVFIFVLFGSFLMRSGAGEFIVDLARVASRRLIGGPGYVAILSSALTGTVSGSAIANTVTTGVVTIPLMKQSGFRARYAAAVEASASTGGQLMPPIMGAGAFLIASYTQTPFGVIAAISIVPALLFFMSLAFYVRLEARKTSMRPMEADPRSANLHQVVRRRGAPFLIPVAGVVVLLVMGYTPIWAGVGGIALVIAAWWISETPLWPRDVCLALADGARNAALTCLLLVAIGLVVNVIAMTGLGATFSLMIVEWAAGSMLLALFLVAVASLVLGMGLPVTAAYVVLATLSAPALAQIAATDQLVGILARGNLPDGLEPMMALFDPGGEAVGQGRAVAREFLAGLPPNQISTLIDNSVSSSVMAGYLIAAHLAVFWLSQDSNVTPPVCLTAFAGAAIAESPPMRTGLIAWKISKAIYVLPIAFFTTPIVDGTLQGALMGGAIVLIALAGLITGLEGYYREAIAWPVRIALLAAGGAVLIVDGATGRIAAMLAVAGLLGLVLGAPTRVRPGSERAAPPSTSTNAES